MNNRHVYEGWHVSDFINELEWQFDLIMSGQSFRQPFKSKGEIKQWTMDNQPYYKKAIPEVINYLTKKAGI